ncbi:MAG: tetratricopeptide repeat protein [Bacteroidia bacterium]|nr:tetratricopeptide repeat protein [Bacteroidia bacterium]
MLLIISIIFLLNLPAASAGDKKFNDSIKAGLAGHYSKLATAYADSGRFDSALIYFQKSVDLSKMLNDSAELSMNLLNIGEILRKQGNYNEAIKKFKLSVVIKQKTGDKTGTSKCYNNLGLAYSSLGDYSKALDYYQKSLKIKEELNDKRGIMRCYNNIGNIYFQMKNLKLTLEYYDKALSIAEEIEDKFAMSACLNNIGNILRSDGKPEEALANYTKALNLLEAINDKTSIAFCLNNIGIIYDDLRKYELALYYYSKTLKARETLNDRQGIALALNNIGNLYNHKGDFQKAIEYSKKSLDIAKEIGSLDDQKEIFISLSQHYEGLKMYGKSLEYYKLYKHTNDSIFNFESDKRLKEMEAKYQNEKKQKEIELLNKEKRIQQSEIEKKEAQVKQRTIILYAFIGGFILLALLIIVVFMSYKQKKEANKLLAIHIEEIKLQKEEILTQRDEIERQHRLLEERNREVLDSITYALNIQKAILPPEEYISKHLPEHFILYKPKDIVSGDFYWVKEITVSHGMTASRVTANHSVDTRHSVAASHSVIASHPMTETDYQRKNFLVFCVADCTGHGVPGAFMSMLGIALLNEIINNMVNSADINSVSPILASEILNRLRINIIRSLHQTGSSDTSKDGMDIAFCVLDLTESGTNIVKNDRLTLHYAGAYNPLYLIRNPDPQGHLKADPQGHVTEDYRRSNDTGYNKGDLAGQLSEYGDPAGRGFIEVKADKMPIGGVYTSEKMLSFTENIIPVYSSDMLYIFSDGFADQQGGMAGKKFKYSQFKELLLSLYSLSVEEQKKEISDNFEKWKGSHEQIDDVTVLGMRI